MIWGLSSIVLHCGTIEGRKTGLWIKHAKRPFHAVLCGGNAIIPEQRQKGRGGGIMAFFGGGGGCSFVVAVAVA